MNSDLENIKKTIDQSASLSDAEKEILLNSIKAVDKELTIVAFKLERTEKVKRTTSVLLEETIDELEKKRADVEQANTALKKSLEELKAAQAQLIQSEKMASLGELTAGIAHEIQNPLNFVNNFSDVSVDLIEEMNEEISLNNHDEVKDIAHDLKSNLEKIRHHGQRASGIVKGMLEHSRTGDGVKEPTDLNALADEYLRLAYHGMRAKEKGFNAEFKTEFDPDLPKLNVVPQDIGRVLLNLINNAFYACAERLSAGETGSLSAVNKKADRHSESKGSLPAGRQESGAAVSNYKPEVIITTKKRDSFIEISVKDNGPGIPEQVRDKIFQPFFTTKPTGSGTGLGLSLSYDIVKAHGGEIKVESRDHRGTEFIITVPV